MAKYLLFVAAACTLTASVFGTTVKLDFTGVTNQSGSSVQTFYQKTYGITFSSTAMVWNTYLYNPGIPNSDFGYVSRYDANCATNDGHENCTSLKAPFSNNVVMQGVLGGNRYIIMNAPNGIAGNFSFQTEGSNGNSWVSIFSGLNGTGKLLESIWIPYSGKGVLTTWSNEIALDPTFRVQIYGGIGYSIVFDQGRGYNGSGSGYIEYDNISFTQPGNVPGNPILDGGPISAPSVPEPGSLALLLSGGLAALPVIRQRFTN